jgi:hypothetical protein
MRAAVCLLSHTPLWCVQVCHLLYTHRSQLHIWNTVPSEGNIFLSQGTSAKICFRWFIKIHQCSMDWLSSIQGFRYDLNDSVLATPDAAVSLADVLLKSVVMKASRHIFNIICSVPCEYSQPQTPTNAQFIQNQKSIIYMNSPTCFTDIATYNMHSGTSMNFIQEYVSITAPTKLMFLYLQLPSFIFITLYVNRMCFIFLCSNFSQRIVNYCYDMS